MIQSNVIGKCPAFPCAENLPQIEHALHLSVSSTSRGRCGPNSMHECCQLPAVIIGQRTSFPAATTQTFGKASHGVVVSSESELQRSSKLHVASETRSRRGRYDAAGQLAISGSHSCQRIPKPIETTRHRLHGEN